ncbi:MAG: hypothetical protein V3V19_06025 [Cocleimonas sp.]
MRKRTFIFDGSEGVGGMLIAILNHYADVAYPLGGSDCAAASREAIQAIADKIKLGELAEISRRQRPMLKSAVKWFYTESVYASPDDVMYNKILSQLS